ncbi:MAG: AraC family transcriptional regulator [Oscillospiraceae bacterium]|nr:AraC family transcriptional regulator [Oscillospiraceae bacterium]
MSETAERIKAYIKSHLQEPITASDVAKAAGYSQFHAARLFKEETGLSPFEYIRRERLIDSARTLRNGKAKVIDVAFDYVFNSHEGFTRAFANAFGITPKKYADYPNPNANGWLIPYRYLDRQKFKSEETNMIENTAVIFTQIIERPARKLILKRSKSATHYFEYCEEVGCGKPPMYYPAPADILNEIKEALYESVGVWLPDNMRPEGTGVYASAVEVPVDYAGEIPEGFDVIDLEPCKMLVFQGEPFDDENYDVAIGDLWKCIEKFNPEVYGYRYDYTIAPKMQLAPFGWRGYIELHPVVEIK